MLELKQLGPKKWAVYRDGQEEASGSKIAMETLLAKLNEPIKKIFTLAPDADNDFRERAKVFGSQQKAFEAAVECVLALDPSQIPALQTLIDQSGVPLRKHMEAAWIFLLSGSVVQTQ